MAPGNISGSRTCKRDTQYIDMIWLDFLGYDYPGVERSVRNTLAEQHDFRPTTSALYSFST